MSSMSNINQNPIYESLKDNSKNNMPKKTKRISKKEKNDKRKQDTPKRKESSQSVENGVNEIYENEERVKKGRPSQKDKVEITEDPTADSQEKILEYLSEIGIKHGLFFRQRDRKRLTEQNNKKEAGARIEWHQTDVWERNLQIEKVKKNNDIWNVLQRYSEQNDDLKQDDLVEMLVNIGDLATKECTMEIYQMLALVLKLILWPSSEANQSCEIARFFEGARFLNGTFTKQKIKYWIEIKADKDKIRTLFFSMIADLKSEIRSVLLKPNKLKDFIREQKQTDEELQKIIQCGGMD